MEKDSALYQLMDTRRNGVKRHVAYCSEYHKRKAKNPKCHSPQITTRLEQIDKVLNKLYEDNALGAIEAYCPLFPHGVRQSLTKRPCIQTYLLSLLAAPRSGSPDLRFFLPFQTDASISLRTRNESSSPYPYFFSRSHNSLSSSSA